MYKFKIHIVSLLILLSCNQVTNQTDKPDDDQEGASIETQQATSSSKDITESFCRDFDISSGIQDSYLGAFGENYYRIDLSVDSAAKKSSCSYAIYGTTTLKNKKVKFSGDLTITKVETENTNLYGINDSTNYETNVYADYTFNEDIEVDGAGVFSGKFHLLIHLTKDNKIDWNTWDWMGDGYTNYIFDGQWISPKGNRYISYFADGKLDIGDLNGGAGEFVPNEKYLEFGWWDYAEMYYANDTALVNRMRKLKAANRVYGR